MARGRRVSTAAAVAVSASLLVGALVLVARDDHRSDGAQRPNIVVIMTDDQTVESMRVMGNVQRLLVDQGTTFTDSITSFPLCCPSRATFLTGQYAHNHGVWGNTPPEGGYEAFRGEDSTMPVALQRAGYTTVHVGKYLNGYGTDDPSDAPPGWDEWHTELDPRTLRYFGFSLLENGEVNTYGPDDYSTDVFTEIAVEKIRAQDDTSSPYFLTVDYFAPHTDFTFEESLGAATPAPRHLGLFSGEPLPAAEEAFDEADVSDKPQEVRSLPRITPSTRNEIRRSYARYLESLLAVDEGVEQIVEAVAAAGDLDNTIFIFTSDNGYLFGEHRIPSGKVWFYEPSLTVPLVVRGPGVAPGAERRSLVANIDLAPTILDLAGAESLRTADGTSLTPLFEADDRGDRRVLLESGVPDDRTLGVRTSQHLYVEHPSGERELYDLEADRLQLVNLAGRPTMSAIEAGLASTLDTLRECAGATCR